MDEQLKLAQKVVDVVDRPDRNICATLLRYTLAKPDSSYAQVRIVARKKEDEKYQQSFYVNNKLEEVIYIRDVMNSIYDKDITNKTIFKVLNSNYFFLIIFLSV